MVAMETAALDVPPAVERILGGGAFSVETFVECFPVLVDAAHGPERLKDLVRELAVRGRLSTRGEDDEPVDRQLACVAQERSAHTANRRNMVGDEPEVPTAVPFVIPGDWRWIVWDDVVLSTSSGWSPQCENRPRADGEWGVLKVSAVSWDTFKSDENKTLPKGVLPRTEFAVRRGDFLLSRANTAELVGRSVTVTQEPERLLLSDKLVRCVFSIQVEQRYMNLYNRTSTARAHYVANASGTSDSMKNISRGVILSMPVPLPPRAEQKRIVARVDQLMALIDELEAKQNRKREVGAKFTKASLEALTTAEGPEEFDAAWKRVVENWEVVLDGPEKVDGFRRIVLELAMRGSLVRQMPSEGTASALMLQVQQEREDLISGRRMTGRGHNANLADEPFTPPHRIPNTWQWACLSDVAGHIVDGTHHTPKYVDEGVDFISAKDIKNARVVFSECRHISKEEFAELARRCAPKRGHILVTKSGSIGDVAVVETDRPFTLFESVALVPIVPSIDPNFASWAVYLQASGRFGDQNRKGMAVQHLHLVDLRRLPFPVPPTAEQKRIVAKVEHLMTLCDGLEASLRRADDRASKLAEAVVQEMVA